MRYLVVPSKERKREKKAGLTNSTKSQTEAKSNGFNGLWYMKQTKIAGELTLILNCWEKCSKLKNTQTKNIAECRQMETPQSGFSDPNFNRSNLLCLLFWLALFKLQSQSKSKQALECSIWKLHLVYVSCNSEIAISEQQSSKICKKK